MHKTLKSKLKREKKGRLAPVKVKKFMVRKKSDEIKKAEKEETKVLAPTPSVPTEKEELEILYKSMKDRGFNSIGDIENKIARL